MNGFMEGEVFIPNGDSRTETAVVLVATAEEHGFDQRVIRTTALGFFVPEALADLAYGEGDLPEGADPEPNPDEYDPADYTVDQVKDFVTEHPDLADDVLASEEDGKNRTTLVDWLAEFIETSGDRAVKNNSTDKE